MICCLQEIPAGLKKARCRAAYEEFMSPGCLQSSVTTGIKREKIDVIEVEYQDAAGSLNKFSKTVYPAVEGFLKGLLNTGNLGTGGVVSVVRT